jgi:hypothetical protein
MKTKKMCVPELEFILEKIWIFLQEIIIFLGKVIRKSKPLFFGPV